MVKLIFAILALAMAVVATSVQAQTYDPNYPVCMHVYGELEGDRMDCIFTSLPQCAAYGLGSSGNVPDQSLFRAHLRPTQTLNSSPESS